MVSAASARSSEIVFGNDTINTKVLDVNCHGLVDVPVGTGTESETFLALRLSSGLRIGPSTLAV